MHWDVASDVPPGDLALIRSGFATASDYIERQLGGDITPARKAEVIVKVVATGRGNEENGGGGSCCTGLSESSQGQMRPFFDVKHPHWVNQWGGWPADAQRETTAIHEYTHGWQNTLGCLTQYSQPLGNWMNEGIAVQVSYAAMIEGGAFTKDDVLAFMESSSKDGAGQEWNTPLSSQAEPGSGIWSGHIGYLALEFAMHGAPNGIMQIRDVCTQIANGATRDQAFEAAFGMPLNDFYNQFELWKAGRPG